MQLLPHPPLADFLLRMKNVIARKSPIPKCHQLKKGRLAIGQIGFLALCFKKLLRL
jgi:hypothetical protein